MQGSFVMSLLTGPNRRFSALMEVVFTIKTTLKKIIDKAEQNIESFEELNEVWHVILIQDMVVVVYLLYPNFSITGIWFQWLTEGTKNNGRNIRSVTRYSFPNARRTKA